jgi:PAS domain S-box-containing protein
VSFSSVDFGRLFDASPNPYLVLDRQLHVAAANRAYLQATGQSLDDIVGRFGPEVFPTDPGTLAQVTASIRRVFADSRPDTMALLHYDVAEAGTGPGGVERRLWSLVHSPVFDDAGEVAYVMQHALDVTGLGRIHEDAVQSDRPRSAEAGIINRACEVQETNTHLTLETKRLRALFEKSLSFTAILSGPEHRFEFVNEAYSRLVGGRSIVGQPVRDALPDLADQGFFTLLDQVFATGERHLAYGAPIQLCNCPDEPPEELFLDFIFEPMRDHEGLVTGIFVTGYDVTGRVRAEAEQKADQARLAAALAVARLGAFEWNVRTGAFLLDERSREIFGFDEALDITPEQILDRIHPEDLGRVEAASRRAIAEGTALDISYRIQLPDGSERLVHSISDPVLGSDGVTETMIGAYADETERSAALAALRDSEERNRRIVEGVRDHSIFTTDREGVVVDWTAGAEAVFGWRADEIVGRDAAILFTPEDRACRRPVEELRIAAGNGCAADERWHVRKDGSRFFANGSTRPLHDLDGRIAGFIKIARDDTKRRDMEAALRESEARLRALTNNLPCGMVFQLVTGADGSERRFVFISQSFETLTGYPLEQVKADPSLPYRMILEEDRAWLASAEAEAIAQRKPFDMQVRFRHSTGELRWSRIISAPREQPDGSLIWDGIQIDITEQKQAEEALRSLNETLERRVAERAAELAQTEEQLRQSQKMEAIGQLTGGVAHDFNNLLTIIRSSADLLRRPELPPEKRRRYMDAIADTADRAAKLTSQLLAFARRQALKPQVFNVDERVSEVADMLRTILGARITLDIEVRCHDCRVEADPAQLETALVNLAVNARDAMKGEGRLTVTINVSSSLPPIRGHAGGTGDFVTVAVADTGEGIGAEVVGRIFEPFFTTKEVGRGTGLGLSQVFGFAKQSGGEISVESEVGSGTRFTLYLPRVYEAAAVTEQPVTDQGQPAQGRILVVEDNVAVGEFAIQTLSDLGYEPELVPNAAEALRRLHAGWESYDAMFSDVVMPGMSGIELARIAREHWPDLPVILTSGYSEALATDSRHGFQLLRKPYSVDELSAILRRALAQTARIRESTD